MSSERVVSRLTDQVVSATGQASRAKAEGRSSEVIDSIRRSLRLTLACVLQSQDPREVGAEGFVCVKGHMSDPLVWYAGRSLPVSGSYFESLLTEAGVELAPGQVILLDAALARNLCEEALSRNGFQEAILRQEKRVLTAACMAADHLEHGLPPAEKIASSEAA